MTRLARASAVTPAESAAAPTMAPSRSVRTNQQQGDRRHGEETDDGPVGHPAGLAVPDQDALVETTKTDGARPRQENEQRQPGSARNLLGKTHEGATDETEDRRKQKNAERQGDRRVEGVGEGAEAQVGRAIGDERGGGAHHHDHRRLGEQGEAEGHPECGQVVLRRPEPGDDRRQKRPFHRHHQPGGRQGQPEEEDPALGQG